LRTDSPCAPAFPSIDDPISHFGDFFRIRANDTGVHQIRHLPQQSFGSYSGDIMASQVFDGGSSGSASQSACRRDVTRVLRAANTEGFVYRRSVDAHTLLAFAAIAFVAQRSLTHPFRGTAAQGTTFPAGALHLSLGMQANDLSSGHACQPAFAFGHCDDLAAALQNAFLQRFSDQVLLYLVSYNTRAALEIQGWAPGEPGA